MPAYAHIAGEKEDVQHSEQLDFLAKTKTLTDAWTVGYPPQYVVAPEPEPEPESEPEPE